MLLGDVAPHFPASHRLGIEGCRGVMVTVGGSLGAGTIGDEDEVILGEVDRQGIPLMSADNLHGSLLLAADIEFHIADGGIELEIHSCRTEVFH